MTIGELDRQLDARLAVLRSEDESESPRRRTIEAVIDWSYGSLADREKRLFRKLSVFRGAIPNERADALFGADAGAAMETLHRKSLLEIAGGGGYRMLEVIRSSAGSLLRDAGEEAAAYAEVTQYFCAMLEGIDERWARLGVSQWLAPVAPYEATIRAVLDWALAESNDIGGGIALAVGAARIWNEQARETEIERYLAIALEREAQAPLAVRARLWLAYARYCDVRGAFNDALDAAQRSRAYAVEAGDRIGTAFANLALGSANASLNRSGAAMPYLEEALTYFRAVDGKRAVATALTARAALVEPQQTIGMLEEVLAIARTMGNRVLEAITLSNLGEAQGRAGDTRKAREYCGSSVALFEELGALTRLARARLTLATYEFAEGAREAAHKTTLAAIDQLRLLPTGRLHGDAALLLARLTSEEDPCRAARYAGLRRATSARWCACAPSWTHSTPIWPLCWAPNGSRPNATPVSEPKRCQHRHH